MKWAAAAVGGFLAFLMAIVLGVAITAAAACGPGAGQIDVASIGADTSSGDWNQAQLINAAHIMNAASSAGLSVRAQQLGVMTAMGESSLVNLDHGDGATNPDGTTADSIGLFQQQSSWGSTTDRMNPEKAAALFFARLVTIDGWETLDPSAAAHQVQRNADPNHYAQWWDAAVAVTDYLGHTYAAGGSVGCTTGQAALPLKAPYMMTDDFGPRAAPTDGGSSWHAGVDLAGQCGDPIYAVVSGKVVQSDRLTLGIQAPDGFTVLYLHSALSDRSVSIGDQVTKGQQISLVGNEAPSTGCHLHLAVVVDQNTNTKVAGLPLFPEAPGYVDPEAFMKLFGVELCPPDWCRRTY